MSMQSHHRRTTAFLFIGVALMLACDISTTSSGAVPAAAATQAAMQLQGTAMVLQLTQSALNAPVQPANPPAAAPIPNTPTATVAPRIVLNPSAIEIEYGQKVSGYSRKNEGAMYGFKGTQGDIVTILVASSNARPAKDPKCLGLTASTTFTLKTQNTTMPAVVEATHLTTIRDYTLPATAAYYITVTCVGGGCNGYCTQADVSVNKN